MNTSPYCSFLFTGYPDCTYLIPGCTQIKGWLANRFVVRNTHMHRSFTTTLPRLYCKPQLNGQALFYSKPAGLPKPIIFYSLDLEKHLPTIHQWVNLPYSQKFWQMGGTYNQLVLTYLEILCNPNAHSFAGYYNNELICQVDIYRIDADELGLHLPGEGSHCGFHLLMGPNNKPVHGLTKGVVHAFLHYYFSFKESRRIYGEPDARNTNAISILEKARFQFSKYITLSYKTAALYYLDRDQFFQV